MVPENGINGNTITTNNTNHHHINVAAGSRVTILSIDGGGIRGVIPATILQFLEEELQILDGPDARIADYFDLIAGTSTGGLIAGALTNPDEKGHSRYNMQDVMKLYTNDGPTIFTRRSQIPVISSLLGPKYQASGIESLLKNNFKDAKMKDTLSELLIPSFDIKTMRPVYFSTSEAMEDESKNAFLRDVLRGTSAAPTYFPPTLFYTTNSRGERRAYNLIDGGVAMNNPTYHSIVHLQKEIFKKNPKFRGRTITEDFKSLLVLSLGTGTIRESYDTRQTENWGIMSWMLSSGKSPMIDIITQASADVVDFNLSVLFHTLQCPENYLRVQALNLPQSISAIDDPSPTNVKNLRDVANKLLSSYVMSPDVDSGKYVPQRHRGTNKEAIIRFAKHLVEERRARKQEMHKL